MPAAAVIPAPIAYINVVAVKKLVVGFLARAIGAAPQGVVFILVCFRHPRFQANPGLHCSGLDRPSFTVNKLECSKQGCT